MSYLDRAFRMVGRPVPRSPEFQRIAGLPRKTPDSTPSYFVWQKPGCGDLSCPYHFHELRDAQVQALSQAAQARGLLAPMGVGHGKTLTSFLLPSVLGAKRPALLIPPSLRVQTVRTWEHLSTHWTLTPLKIVAYSDLSSPTKGTVLEDYQPDLVIADEAHCLKNPKAARTKRFLRYFKLYPETLFCGLSGTMCQKSIRDWSHLSRLALRECSPAPRDWATLDHWAWALDDLGDMDNCPPGALETFCRDGEDVRQGYRRRVVETPGVVATLTQECDATLVIHRRALKLPAPVAAALKELRDTWSRPDGEEFAEALEFSRYARQLACGLYKRWNPAPPKPWLEARRDWNREVRTFLSQRARRGLDSEALYTGAVKEGRLPSSNWGPWAALAPTFRARTETVWLSEFMAIDAAAWAKDTVGVVWVATPDLGRRIAELAGIRYYGENAGAEILDVTGEQSIVASIQAHGEGRNLQCFHRQLVTYPSSNGKVWEQLLGRLHRQGQKEDEVETWVYLHTPEAREAFERAYSNSGFIEKTLVSQPQRLRQATITFDFAHIAALATTMPSPLTSDRL